MRKIVKHLALLAVALAASPVAAADNLTCMNSGYDDEQLTLFAEMVADYDHAAWASGIPPRAVVVTEALTARANQCAAEHGWSPVAVQAAVTWRFSEFLWTALRLTEQLTPDEVTRLASATDESDRPRLYRVFGLRQALVGDGPVPDVASQPADDLAYLNQVASRSGVALDSARAEYVGAMMAARLTKHFSAERFSAN